MSETSADSDVENVSDIENSRVIEVLRPDSSTPKRPIREHPNTQTTQQLNPLTTSQLKRMTGEEHDFDVDETRDELKEVQNILTSIPEGHSEHILSSSEASEEEESARSNYLPPNVALGLIENVVTRTNSIPSEKCINAGEVAQPIQSSPDSWGLPIKNAGSVIDETPIKLLSMPATSDAPFVYLLVKWKRSPHFWPARCERIDFINKKAKSRVLFAKRQYGDVDLRQQPLNFFELNSGDFVHIEGKPAKNRYKVVGLGVTNLPEDSLYTSDGFNLVTVKFKDEELSIDAENIYLTKSDMQNYMSKRLGKVNTPLNKNMDERGNFDSPLSRNSDANMTHISGNITTVSNVTTSSLHSKPPISSPLSLLNDNSVINSKRRKEGDQTPRKRRPRSAPSNFNASSLPSPIKGSDDSEHLEEEEYDLKSSPIGTPIKHSRNMKNIGDTWKNIQPNSDSSLFKNCMFSISSHDSQSVKSKIKVILIENGASVLDDGLSEVVQLTDIGDESGSLPDHECNFGSAKFAAVLSDEPRRTLKYLEMVALGWPCLSITYIYHCVEQNKMVDWRPYLLPAGDSNLIDKKMTVSLNTTAFYQHWLQGMSLEEQFNNRKVTFRCTTPLCIVVNKDTFHSNLVLLASFCCSRFKLWFYTSKREVPDGSILLELKPTTNISKEIRRTDPLILEQLQYYAAADSTVVKNTEWMIQCIINGGLV